MFDKDSRFIVVDDSRLTRELIREALRKLGFLHIDTAKDGLSALEKIKAAISEGRPFHLAFLDINMPGIDGIKLLETLRGLEITKDILVIMITTEGAKETVIHAIVQGVSGYIVKPFGIVDVQKKIKELYERANEAAKAKR